MQPKRLAILTTHPIQYQAPWFRALAAHPGVALEVIFCHQAGRREQAEAGFGVEFDWDVPLLEGYPHRFLRNVAKKPSVCTFAGLDTPDLGELIRRERFDALVVSGWHYKSAWQAIMTCWSTRTPVLVRGDSHLHRRTPAARRLAKRSLYRWFVPRLDACLAVGQWSREYFLYYGARPDRVFVVPHVTDARVFGEKSDGTTVRRWELRREWGLPSEAMVFLFAGKFVEKKRPMDFVEAVNRAARRGARIAGLMVGDGPLRPACEEFAERHDVPIRFAGFLNQSCMADAYVAADGLVLPSDGGETWGLVVNEAMACGRACIVSDEVGCGPDLVRPGETGAIFPMGDVEALADQMITYAAEPEALQAMGEQARQRIARESARVAAERLVEAVSAVTR